MPVYAVGRRERTGSLPQFSLRHDDPPQLCQTAIVTEGLTLPPPLLWRCVTAGERDAGETLAARLARLSPTPSILQASR